MTRVVVYEDDEIVVHGWVADSRIVVVTFSSMTASANSAPWAGAALEKLGISYLGFVSKRPNWFPAASVHAAHGSLRRLFPDSDSIVTYGYSQGAYAALKYAALFDARLVLAFSPQHSIAPATMAGKDDRYHRYYRETNGDHGVCSLDIGAQARVVCFFDPEHRLDRLHAELIRSAVPRLEEVKFYGAGHETARIVLGTDKLDRLLRLGLGGDGLHAFARGARRSQPDRRSHLLRWLPLRKTATVKSLLRGMPALAAEVVLGVIYNLAGAAEQAFILDNMAVFCAQANPPAKVALLHVMLSMEQGDRALDLCARWLADEPDEPALFACHQMLQRELAFPSAALARIAANDVVYGFGWFAQEPWGRWGRALRSRLFLGLDRGGRRGLIRIPVRSLSAGAGQRLSVRYCWADQVRTAAFQDGCFEIDVSSIGSACVAIDFCIDRLYSPCFLNQGDDQRPLGIGVARSGDWHFD